MTPRDTLDMMRRCMGEIQSLKREIEELRPKAHAYDNIAHILRLLPRPSMGYSENILWRLEQEIKSEEAAIKAATAPANAVPNSEEE